MLCLTLQVARSKLIQPINFCFIDVAIGRYKRVSIACDGLLTANSGFVIVIMELRTVARTLLPPSLRRPLSYAHRRVVFRRAMPRFLRAPAACAVPGDRLLLELIYGWGNEEWSALDEYLAACIQYALVTSGPILECGSGLSTLVVGAIAKQRGIEYWVLEHSPEWAAKLQRDLDRYQIESARICVAPLRSYGEFDWYDAPLESLPDRFTLVICDGPPYWNKGGRFGLGQILRPRLTAGCVILLDDGAREEERAIADQWAADLGASSETLGTTKPYLKLTISGIADQIPLAHD
jgi:hypothetical protein